MLVVNSPLDSRSRPGSRPAAHSMVACTAVALVLANSPLAESFASLWKIPVLLSIGDDLTAIAIALLALAAGTYGAITVGTDGDISITGGLVYDCPPYV